MMIVNWVGGMAVGVVCASILLLFDVADIRTLLWQSDMPVAGTLMLLAAFAFTFGGIVAATAVMRMGDDDDEPPRGGRKFKLQPTPRPAYATVAAHPGARRTR